MTADDNKSPFSSAEEEYQFTEPGSTTSTDVFSDIGIDGESRVAQIAGRVTALVIIAALLFAVYKLYGMFMHTKHNTVVKQPAVQKSISSPAQLPLSKQHQFALPKTTQPTAIAKKAQLRLPETPTVTHEHVKALRQGMGLLEQRSADTQTTVTSLNSSLSNMQSQVNNMSEQLGSVTETLHTITKLLDTQQQHLAQIRKSVAKPRRAVKHSAHMQREAARTHYYLQAAIPGRAWLIRADGSTRTVSQGSKIAGYGFVRRIDPVRGTVMTSSGYTIKFRH